MGGFALTGAGCEARLDDNAVLDRLAIANESRPAFNGKRPRRDAQLSGGRGWY